MACRSLTRRLSMKGDALGSKYFVSAGNADQTRHGDGSPCPVNMISPCSSAGKPRLSRYQALSMAGSFALKKMPPTPTTRSMATSIPEHGSALIFKSALPVEVAAMGVHVLG